MKGFLIEHAFALFSGALVAPLVTVLVQQLKKFWDTFNGLGDLPKRGAVVVLAVALQLLSSALGVALPAACSDLTATISTQCQAGLTSDTFLAAVISAALAMVLHFMTRPAAPASKSDAPPAAS